MSIPSLTLNSRDRSKGGRSQALPGIRILAAIGIVALALVAPPLTLGAHLESLVAPVLTAQVIPPESVSQAGGRLCWTWMRDKMRAPAVLDIDVVLIAQNGDRSYPEVFDDVSGMPWHRGGALPPGHHENRLCIQWPKFLAVDEPVRLRQTVRYAGLFDLWTLRIPLPDVVTR